MKIKKLLTESSLLMAIAIVATVGVASAAVINYLTTGQVINKTAITAPIDMSINEGRDGSASGKKSIDMAVYGGSDFLFTTVAKNNANNDIEGYRAVVLDAPSGKAFVGGEITDILMDTAVTGEHYTFDYFYVVKGNGTLVKLSDWTKSSGSDKLVLVTSRDSGSSAEKDKLTAGAADWNAFTMTTNPAIEPGNYRIYSDFVVDLTSYAVEQYSK